MTLTHAPTGQFVTVNPGFGGMLHQLGLWQRGSVVDVLDTYASAAELRAQFAETYKGAKLSPFANMVEGGRYAFGGQTHQLPLNWPADGHALHGFVADKPFAVVSQTATGAGAVLVLRHEEAGDQPGYPFPFRLTIAYQFTIETGLSCRTTVENVGSDVLPLGDGWHPYLRLGGRVDDWQLSLPAEALIELNGQFIPTGRVLPADDFREFCRIGDRHFDTCFRVNTGQSTVVTHLTRPEVGLGVSVWQETGPDQYRFLQVYTPPDRRSIAIEPMTGWPDAFNNRQGLVRLGPGGVWTATFGIHLT